MRISIKYDPESLTETREVAKLSKNTLAFIALYQISENIFRKARKYGFTDPKLNDLMEKLGPDAYELIGALEQEFNDVLTQYGLHEYIYD